MRAPPLLAIAHSFAAVVRRCHGDLIQAMGREAPGDVCAAHSSSPAASQFLPILEESRSPSADARALAPFKGNRRSGGFARARELSPPPSREPGAEPGPGKPPTPYPPTPPPILAPSTHFGEISTMEKGDPALAPCSSSPTGEILFP